MVLLNHQHQSNAVIIKILTLINHSTIRRKTKTLHRKRREAWVLKLLTFIKSGQNQLGCSENVCQC